jgi:hypothetical protein
VCGDGSFFGEGDLPGGESGDFARLKIELHTAKAVVNGIEAVENLPEDETHSQLRQAKPPSSGDCAGVDVLLNAPRLKDREHAAVVVLRNGGLQGDLPCRVVRCLEQRLAKRLQRYSVPRCELADFSVKIRKSFTGGSAPIESNNNSKLLARLAEPSASAFKQEGDNMS